MAIRTGLSPLTRERIAKRISNTEVSLNMGYVVAEYLNLDYGLQYRLLYTLDYAHRC